MRDVQERYRGRIQGRRGERLCNHSEDRRANLYRNAPASPEHRGMSGSVKRIEGQGESIWGRALRRSVRNQETNLYDVVEHTKTNRDRYVILVPKAEAILEKIPKQGSYIFMRDGERITARQIAYVLEKFAERQGKSTHKMLSSTVFKFADTKKNGNAVNINVSVLLTRARDGTRTRGLDLGKVALHQLSHSRISVMTFIVTSNGQIILYIMFMVLSTQFLIFFLFFYNKCNIVCERTTGNQSQSQVFY